MDDEQEVLELLYRHVEAQEAQNRQLLGIKNALRQIVEQNKRQLEPPDEG